jgi:hypothetical protein
MWLAADNLHSHHNGTFPFVANCLTTNVIKSTMALKRRFVTARSFVAAADLPKMLIILKNSFSSDHE